MHAEVVDELLLSGRLTLAEAAALTLDELETLAELSRELIALGQTHQGIRVAGALCALFPYEPAYWTVFARALEAGGASAQAAVAQSIGRAFAGEPAHAPDDGRSTADTATQVPLPAPLPSVETTATGVVHAGVTATGITTTALHHEITQTAATVTREVTVTGRHEITQTARLYLGTAAAGPHEPETAEVPVHDRSDAQTRPSSTATDAIEHTRTATALVPRKVAATARRLAGPASPEDTARVDRRFLRSAHHARPARRPTRRSTRTEKTAIIRRRLGLELSSVASSPPDDESTP